MPLQATSGAASYDAFGGGVAAVPKYIEDYFSTFLYSGAGTTQAINNGVDLSAKGGLVWLKDRGNVGSHRLVDTVRGNRSTLFSDSTSAAVTRSNDVSCDVSSFNSNGFTAGNFMNQASNNYVSWSFAEAPKFFDVVTWTGDDVVGREIPHNLGSVPGCIITKCTSAAENWNTYHRSLGNQTTVILNGTGAATNFGSALFNSTNPTATVFTTGTSLASINQSGRTYVAYLFAHNAGGFGLSGTDNVISCGSYATDSSYIGPNVNLGYEPQWILVKNASANGAWYIIDNMRGWESGGNVTLLNPNSSAEESTTTQFKLNATGFQDNGAFAGNATMIYIAIRRGPMKVPTTGTSVFKPVAITGTGSSRSITTPNFPVDLAFSKVRNTTFGWSWEDRLRGATKELMSNNTDTEYTYSDGLTGFDSMVGYALGADSSIGRWNYSGGYDYGEFALRRAPGFFDEICFSGSGANKTEAHNLGKAPELWLVKSRSGATQWVFGSSLLAANEKIVMPSPNGRVTDATVWNSTYPTASVLSLGTSSTTNASGQTFVGYLWATVAGVSKVGTYTGNGSSQTIDCGFTGGSRFVMIIRATASTAQDIYIWDSARGIVAGNDPRLSLNTTAAEVTSLDTIDTAASGFVVNTDASNVNVNGAVYLYLSIA